MADTAPNLGDLASSFATGYASLNPVMQRGMEWQQQQADRTKKLNLEEVRRKTLADVFQDSQGLPVEDALQKAANVIMSIDPDLGINMLEKSSTIVAKRVAEKKVADAESKDQANQVYDLMFTVDSQDSWDNAKNILKAKGLPLPPGVGDAYDPKTARLIKQYAMMGTKVSQQIGASQRQQTIDETVKANDDRNYWKGQYLGVQEQRERRLREWGPQRLTATGTDPRVLPYAMSVSRARDKAAEPLQETERKLGSLETALNSDNPAATPMIQRLMGELADKARMTNRLYAANASFGSLDDRAVNTLNKFIEGKYSIENRKEIRALASDFKKLVNKGLSAIQKDAESRWPDEVPKRYLGATPDFYDAALPGDGSDMNQTSDIADAPADPQALGNAYLEKIRGR